MTKRVGALFFLMLLASVVFNHLAFAKGEELNKPIPIEALKLVKQAKDLRTRDRFDEALVALKKAIALAPNYVEAHAAYIETKDYFMERDDEVRAEYDALRVKEPDNPVYIMAEILAYPAPSSKSIQAALQRVAELAPDWAWGHFAKAMIVKRSDPDTAISELLQSIKLDSSARKPYFELVLIYNARRDYDAAIEVARQMADFPGDYFDTGFRSLWEARFNKANRSSAEERAKLKSELEHLIETSQDLEMLNVLHIIASLFRGEGLSDVVVNKLKKLDPTWYPGRGFRMTRYPVRVLGEENRTLAISGQQHVIWQETTFGTAFREALLPSEKIEQLEKLFALKPGRRVTEMIYQFLFQEAEKADDLKAILKYGEALIKIDPNSINPPIKMALALAKKKAQLDKALAHARMAVEATAETRQPVRQRDVDPFRYKDSLLEENRRKQYALAHSTALDALGWTLYQMGRYAEAEAKLQQAAALRRDKDILYHWAAALSKVGRAEESAKIALEAENLLANAVKEEMNKARKEPAKDFTLQTIDGRKIGLGDLKGKVVLINFWATWCGPCIKEIPDLRRLYEKYKDKGFELVAISGDEKADRQKVIDFAKQRKMSFTVVFDEGVFKQYAISAIPTNIFIDRDGRVRYRVMGSRPDITRGLEIALEELLK